MRATWLPNVLRAAGLTVVEIAGWRGRGRAMAAINGVVGHDTVTTRSWSDVRVDALLRDGRQGLPGPLAQLGLDRAGRLRLIADGRCNHNGYGRWGNDAIGIEVYCAGGMSGREEPWNDTQRDAFERATAAILTHLGRDTRHVLGHKETDPRRKIDPYGVDMHAVRQVIARHMSMTTAGGGVTPIEEDDVKQEDIDKIVDGVITRIHKDGLTPRTKDDVAKRTWLTETHGKEARNRLHDIDVRTQQIRAALDKHREFDVTEPEDAA